LNVGPKADGTFPQESIDILKGMGAWMKVNSEAVYGTKASPLEPLAWGRCTKKQTAGGTTLYLSVFDWPADGKLFVPGLKNEVAGAKLMANGITCKTENINGGIMIALPAQAPDAIASVVKLEIKGNVETIAANAAR
jgi:alpha-L-fucosidase